MESSESVSVDAVKESKKVNTYLGKRMQDGKNLPVIHCKVITINYCRYLRCTIILVGYLFLVLDLNKMHVTTRTIAATATTPAIRIERPVYHWEYDTKLVNSTETQKQTRL